jgi:hypothetical protein
MLGSSGRSGTSRVKVDHPAGCGLVPIKSSLCGLESKAAIWIAAVSYQDILIPQPSHPEISLRRGRERRQKVDT